MRQDVRSQGVPEVLLHLFGTLQTRWCCIQMSFVVVEAFVVVGEVVSFVTTRTKSTRFHLVILELCFARLPADASRIRMAVTQSEL